MKILESKYKFKLTPQKVTTLKARYREIKTKIPQERIPAILENVIRSKSPVLKAFQKLL